MHKKFIGLKQDYLISTNMLPKNNFCGRRMQKKSSGLAHGERERDLVAMAKNKEWAIRG